MLTPKNVSVVSDHGHFHARQRHLQPRQSANAEIWKPFETFDWLIYEVARQLAQLKYDWRFKINRAINDFFSI